jgi:3-deoxy-D-manno-octulosonic-acid transferase
MLECAIMSGHKMSNFLDLMLGMTKANALIIASTENEIFENTKRLFSTPEEVKQLGMNGKKFVEANSGALGRTVAVISGFKN